MQKYLLMLFIAVGLVACQDELQPTPVNNPSESDTKSDYSISAEEALASLDEFLTEGEDPVSRSTDRRVVKSIVPVSYRSVKSRAADQNLDCDNLVYIANFEQAKGYAILAADKRISDKVIAVVDDGELAVSDVLTPYEPQDDDTRVYFDGYPMTGPGFFTMEETGDELFMNPNTVSLYDETRDDTLVGNFDPDAEDESDAQNTQNVTENSVKKLTSNLCVNYAINEISNFDPSLYQPQNASGKTQGDAEGNSNQNPAYKRTEQEATPWSIVSQHQPMLSAMVSWHQRSPFNDLYPVKCHIPLFWNKRKARAGCFPLAIAKLLTYFEIPKNYSYKGTDIDWKALKFSAFSSKGKESAAALLKSISDKAGCLCFYTGTFTFPGNATATMRRFGLANAKSIYYRFNRVVEMIDEGKPVIIYGMPGINITKSHCWNIDGYKVKERKVTTREYYQDILRSTYTQTETFNMVHCDFGWEGDCNGYYVDGVFKLNDANSEKDKNERSTNKTHYNRLIRIVSYTKP